MKIREKILVSTMILMLIGILPVQAAEYNDYYSIPIETANVEMYQYFQGENTAIAKSLSQERGSIIDTALAQISNEGGGDIGILLITTAHVECTEIKNIGILERLENDGSWEEIARYEFDAKKEDFPTQDLSGMTNEFTVENQETDRYYRVRGIHCVWADGKAQAFSTMTDGILITEYDY